MIELDCPHCGKHLSIAEQYAGQTGSCQGCGGAITVPGGFVPPAGGVPHIQPGQAFAPPRTPDPMDTIIPRHNPSALIGYYCGVFSLIPCVGLVLGPIGFVLGLKGLRAYKENPEIKGKAHAYVGIILGGLCGLANLAGLLLIVTGTLSNL